jgi:hypothetical protein
MDVDRSLREPRGEIESARQSTAESAMDAFAPMRAMVRGFRPT